MVEKTIFGKQVSNLPGILPSPHDIIVDFVQECFRCKFRP